MPTNPFEPPKEVEISPERRPLPIVHKILWGVVIMIPTLLCAALFVADEAGIPTNAPWLGILFLSSPLVSLLAAGVIVLASPASLLPKLGWLVLSLATMVIQVALDVLAFGLLHMYLHGLSGIQ
jgi:hypothetical protein